jgi:hypothetical protein
MVGEAPGDNPPFPKAVKIDYAIEPGWCFWQWGPVGNPELPEPYPDKVMLWVHGDQFKDRMLLRVVDATGQTFQTGSAPKTRDGWELIELSLKGNMGHWGGANDGEVHPPLRWTSYYLQAKAQRTSPVWSPPGSRNKQMNKENSYYVCHPYAFLRGHGRLR